MSVVRPLSVWPSAFAGEINISVPVRCTGDSGTFEVNLFIFEGSILPGHGRLLAEYTQDVSLVRGQQKDVVFPHTVVPTGEARRDTGVEIVAGNRVLASREFDDVYEVETQGAGGGLTDMIGMLMMLGMMAMVMPMFGESTGG